MTNNQSRSCHLNQGHPQYVDLGGLAVSQQLLPFDIGHCTWLQKEAQLSLVAQ